MASPSPDLVLSTPGSLTLEDLEKTLTVYFVGYMFSMVLYGFTVFQAYMYYSRYPKDSWGIKGFVSAVVILDTAVSSILSQTLYYYFVTLFPFTRGVELASRPYCAQLELSVISLALTQLFYAYSVWSESKNTVVSGFAAVLSCGSFIFGSIMTGELDRDKTFASLGTNPSKAIAGLYFAFTAASAIVSFSALLGGPLPHYFMPFQSAFDRLIGYGISYGGLATLVQIVLFCVFIVTPDRHYWIPFYEVASKLFVIGSLTYLNTRESLEPRSSHKEDWNTASASRGFGNTTIASFVSPNTGYQANSKAIMISVDQSTERVQDKDVGMFNAIRHPYGPE